MPVLTGNIYFAIPNKCFGVDFNPARSTIAWSIFSYKVDNRYNAEHDYGINFADSSIDINWHKNHEELIISEKDIFL